MLHWQKWSLHVLLLDWQKIIPRSSVERQHPIFIDAPGRERSDTHKELCLEYERIQCFLVQLLLSQDVRCCLEVLSGWLLPWGHDIAKALLRTARGAHIQCEGNIWTSPAKHSSQSLLTTDPSLPAMRDEQLQEATQLVLIRTFWSLPVRKWVMLLAWTRPEDDFIH